MARPIDHAGAMTMNAVISIQARIESRRLPGKVLLPVMGRPLIAWQIDRLLRGSYPVWVAVPDGYMDARILGAVVPKVRTVTGFGDDPPARHLAVAKAAKADVLGFCGADQVLVSPEHFAVVFGEFAKPDPPDYVRVGGLPYGLHVWGVTRAALEECVADKGRDADEIEHTGAYWDRRPERFRTVDVEIDTGAAAGYRLTIDSPEDFELHRLLMEALDDPVTATLAEIIAVLDAHPEWSHMNAGVSQYYWAGSPTEGVRA